MNIAIYQNDNNKYQCVDTEKNFIYTKEFLTIEEANEWIKQSNYIDIDYVKKNLTKTEYDAAALVLEQLKDSDNITLTISRFADQHGYTRSSIVTALKKLDSYNIIKTQSLGVKGTYIEAINKNLILKLTQI